MKKGSYLLIKKAIEKYDNIFIFHHIRPDGDCLGSQFGLKEMIEATYPDKKVFAVGDSGGILNFLDFTHNNNFTEKDFENSLGIVVDASSSNRIEMNQLILEKKLTAMARIDHHPNGADINYQYNWIDSSFVAAAEQIGYLAWKGKYKLTQKAVEYIYLGIHTDSGRFFYSNTSARTFQVVAHLSKNGLNVFDINQKLALRKLKDIAFSGKVLSGFKTDGPIIYFHVTEKIIKELDLTYEEGSFVNILANIQGYPIWIFFIDQPDKTIRVRLRSNGPKVNIVGRMFNGGGHDMASGATLSSKKEIKKVLEECKKLLEEGNN
ncbi:bifunctional oligoribonuclease/PAP phosphatase NrnA [Mycoplasma iguanae]|uniref:Bifunctional oligoribonuclease/PAP phosphatase NrnA n=1 Tax=Mycoplasma iguanae TaxID=292461 RepID=A0ABY5RBY9_9MOLU|nr:bifunctional oligoribonuclease/PAP phosphatase NrnA [Mycoplasma iguanae]UVD81730.1 bifunctional oligoribonuclease/PAP phosphatase NrnA [Mycoplasma iguanae]